MGTRDNWTSWVIDFFQENNPFYYENFSDVITPEGVAAFLKTQGVERAVVLSEYAPEATGVVTNEFTSAFCRGREEFIPFGSTCLYEGGPVAEQASRAVNELGIRGFKILPTYARHYPNDPILFPFYEVAQDAGVPVMFHTGTSIFKGSRVKYGDPLLLDDVADEFPRLKLLLEHGGRPFWYDRANWLMTRHKNVYIGMAGIPARQLPQHFPNLERYPDRFIFGSDWPGMPNIRALADKVLELPYSDSTKERLLYRNALEVLGLS